ncbi:protein kinase domain-containing protein [Aeromonas hydrophila]
MKDDNEVQWVTSIDFDERWEKIKSMGGGGQGLAFSVSFKKSPGDNKFLKILKEQTNPERRKRMFREAAALATYSHPRIPCLIETNAQLYPDTSAKLYIVTELVPGNTLSSRAKKPFPFDESLQIIDQLADVVEYFHSRDSIHRDIKPDNIILRDNKIDAVLVDFGLTFNLKDQDNWQTGDWEELGNRFLRLPELSSYSAYRHDPRSDISFLAGILYFCLFGYPPALLEDANGDLPHQRSGISLQSVTPNSVAAGRLARFFDIAFQPRLSDRFKTIREFREMIKSLKDTHIKDDHEDPESIAAMIKSGFSKEKDIRQKHQHDAYQNALIWVSDILKEVSVSLDKMYVPTQSGDYDPATDHPYRNMGLHHHYRQHLMRYWLKVTFRFIGSELVITIAEADDSQLNELEILRTDYENPNFTFGNSDMLKTRLLKGISAVKDV